MQCPAIVVQQSHGPARMSSPVDDHHVRAQQMDASAAELWENARSMKMAAREAWKQANAARQATTTRSTDNSRPSELSAQARPVSHQRHHGCVQNEERTTIMFKNVPNQYQRDDLCKMMDEAGLAAQYDFVYLPVDFSRSACLGYAFVNFVSND